MYGKSHSIVAKAVKSGELKRLDTCEICGKHKSEFRTPHTKIIVAHHWKGHDHPLDVWWVCVRCNMMLRGCHDGDVTKAQARQVIDEYVTLSEAGDHLSIDRRIVFVWVRKGVFKSAVRLSELLNKEVGRPDLWLIKPSELQSPRVKAALKNTRTLNFQYSPANVHITP